MDDFTTWLERHGLGKYAPAFAQNDVDLDVLPRLSDDDLKELGLSLGDRRRLQATIEDPVLATLYIHPDIRELPSGLAPDWLRSVGGVARGLTVSGRTGFHCGALVFGHSRSPVNLNRIAILIVRLGNYLQRLLRPAGSTGALAIAAAQDLARSRSALLAENALLRHQLIVLRRNTSRPRLYGDDRVLLLILARLNRRWRDALHLVCADTVLRWHRDLFKIVWRRKSQPKGQPKRLASGVVALIQRMTKDNTLWGAERIDHVVILGERHLRGVLSAYVEDYFNRARPHRGLSQRIPNPGVSRPSSGDARKVVARPILGGLHYDYWRAA